MTKRIITPGEHEGLTPKQKSAVLLPDELPPCEGNPNVSCPHPVQPVMISGYDDKMRCPACNRVHIALVEEEAGAANPTASEPQFVSPKLNQKSKMREMLRRKRIANVMTSLEAKGHTGRPSESTNLQPIAEGDFRDMKDAMSRDEHGTREEGISKEERRRRILAKYGKLKDGNKYQG